LVELEVNRNSVEREHESKVNELEINKSFSLKESDDKLGELERNLELANINKRKNSSDLSAAILVHQTSP